MTLEEYLNEISRGRCPEECDFQQRKDEIARVPPPKEILGIIISCDPTTDWLEEYKEAKELPNDERRKKLFEAIPKKLIEKVENFMRKTPKEDIECLSNMMDEGVYWTHLHKCFTDKSEKKSIKFKPKNAIQCADQWLKKELDLAISNKTKFIIALGRDVEGWICQWREDYCKNKNMEIIYLPHPSQANVGSSYSWNPETKNREKIENRINTLLDLCKKLA